MPMSPTKPTVPATAQLKTPMSPKAIILRRRVSLMGDSAISRLKLGIDRRQKFIDGLLKRRAQQIEGLCSFKNLYDDCYFNAALEDRLNYADLEKEYDKFAKNIVTAPPHVKEKRTQDFRASQLQSVFKAFKQFIKTRDANMLKKLKNEATID